MMSTRSHVTRALTALPLSSIARSANTPSEGGGGSDPGSGGGPATGGTAAQGGTVADSGGDRTWTKGAVWKFFTQF
ncbi:MAG: hypothetical protein JXP73_01560 [Deltaproteobacteria bacterium]|nr:hypothetical protein [Deltaproteobacteria bacterium]